MRSALLRSSGAGIDRIAAGCHHRAAGLLVLPLQRDHQAIAQRRAEPQKETQNPERPDEPPGNRKPPPGMVEQSHDSPGDVGRLRSSRGRRCRGSDAASPLPAPASPARP